jgi:hypothetical protein
MRSLRWLRAHALLIGTFALVFALYTQRYLALPTVPEGDGMYSWLFARSVVFDGDIDFTNDYRLCGDRWHFGVDYGAGRPANPFYFGSALLWTPLLWVARHAISLPAGAPAMDAAGCAGPWVRFAGFGGIVFAIGALAAGYRIARRWASVHASLAGVLVVALGSTLSMYGNAGWYMSHAGSAFGVSVAMLAFLRAHEKPSAKRVVLAGAALGLAALMRPNELVWGAGPGVVVLVTALRDVRARRVPRDAMAFGLLYAAGALIVFSLQLVVWKKLYGAYWVVPTGRIYLQPFHAHPFLLLFSSRCGLLVFTPLMWFGLLGLALFSWRSSRPEFGAALVISTIAAIWICSSPISWSGAHAFGARLLTNLAGPFVATTALFFERVGRRVFASRAWTRRAIALVALPALAITWGVANPKSGVKLTGVAPGPDIYARGLRASLDELYSVVGNPANLPASAVFAARYRLRPKYFDTLADEGIFQHRYRTATPKGADSLDFAHPPSAYVLASGVAGDDGLHVARTAPARFLVTLWWPWVTHLELGLTPPSVDVVMRLTVRGFFTSHTITATLLAGVNEPRIEVPSAFDSGINEVVVEVDSPVDIAWMHFVDESDHDTRIK